jgi:putative salt-induced outer membrane protein YdiY
MTTKNPTALLAILAVCTLAAEARADEVLMKNGDRLSGTLVFDGSKLIIDTKSEGKVPVELKNVKTFSSTAPIDIVLADGTKIHARVDAGPDGQIMLAPPDGAMEVVPFARLKAVNPPPVKWAADVLVGGLLARGNTDSDSFNASADLSHKTERDEISFHGQYLFSRQRTPGDGKHETVDDLLGRAKYQYTFAPKIYAYAGIEAEHDVIAGLDLRLAPNVGLGYQWIDQPNLSFSTEAGIGYLYRQYAHDGEDGAPDARAAYHLKAKLNDKFSVFHNFEYLPGLDRIDNYFIDTDLGLRADITAKIYTEFKIDYRYDSKPAPGHGPNDIRYILGVGVSF